jgi:hypothetical protein
VKDENENVVAALNGSTTLPGFNPNNDTVMFAAGITDLGSPSTEVTATTKIYASGKIKSTDVDLSGKITASSGKIGPFQISSTTLAIVNEEALTTGDPLNITQISAQQLRTYLCIATGTGPSDYSSVAGAIVGASASMLKNADLYTFLSNISRSRTDAQSSGAWDNVGFKATIHGANMNNIGVDVSVYSGTLNYGIRSILSAGASGAAIYAEAKTASGNAFYCPSGVFSGLRPMTRYITSSATSAQKILSEYDFTIVVNNASAITLSLPASPKAGQTYTIFHISGASLSVSGNGNSIFSNSGNALEATSIMTTRGLMFFTWSATYGYWILDSFWH